MAISSFLQKYLENSKKDLIHFKEACESISLQAKQDFVKEKRDLLNQLEELID